MRPAGVRKDRGPRLPNGKDAQLETSGVSPEAPRGGAEVQEAVLGENQQRIAAAVDSLLGHLCAEYQVKPGAVFGRARDRRACFVRGLLVVALRDYGYSLPAIGRAVGGRNHTTIMRVVHKLREHGAFGPVATRTETAAAIGRLRAAIRLAKLEPAPCASRPTGLPADDRPERDEVGEMRVRYGALVERMLAEPKEVALALWLTWCRAEYPNAWEGIVQVPPRPFRLRYPEDYDASGGWAVGRPAPHASAGVGDRT